jgi:hypothetical protein
MEIVLGLHRVSHINILISLLIYLSSVLLMGWRSSSIPYWALGPSIYRHALSKQTSER